jgi:hypothetical protein
MPTIPPPVSSIAGRAALKSPTSQATAVRSSLEDLVQQPAVDRFVRLIRDISELGLTRGQVGAVKAVWFEPFAAFEVEFRCHGDNVAKRALLLTDSIHVVEAASRSSSGDHEPTPL